MAKYRAPVLSDAVPTMKPTIATALDRVMCQVRSLKRPDDHETRTDITPAMRYGGHVSTSVMVVENPSVLTTVGRKFLKPLGDDVCDQSTA
jgi:hypothetical protein